MMKKLFFFVSVMLLTLALVACSSDGEGGSNSDSKSKNNGKTVVSFSYWGGDEDTERLKAIKKEFEKEHDDIEVELVLLPSGEDYAQKQTVMFSGGTPYDVIQFAEESLAYASRGVLEDLTPYIEKDNLDLSEYYDVAMDAYTHNGKVYGMPARVSAMVMFYNKDLFDEHKLEYPTDDWTWDDVEEAAKVIANPDEGIFGTNGLGGWWAGTAQVLHSHGGSILSEDKTAFNLDSPASLKAIERMQRMTWDLDVSPSSDQVPEGVNLWISGKLGMMIDGPWWIAGSQKDVKDFDWDIVPAPADAQDASPTFSNAFHMAKDSKNKDEAWEVIKFFTGEKAQEILAVEHGDVPTMKKVAESDLYLDLGGQAPENFDIMLDVLETAFAPEVSLVWTEVNRVVDEGMSRIINLNEPIDKVMPGMKAEIEELLEEAEELKGSTE